MKKPIRAILLAAGLGSRLRPLTNQTPKCLIKIGDKPIIEHWLEKLEEIGCESCIINTHYLHDQVNEFIANRRKSSMKIDLEYEERLLGTAGTLMKNQNFFKGSIGMLIHADNATDFKLKPLIECHLGRKSNMIMTMLTFTADNPSSCGIVEVNQDNILTDFHEKVDSPPGNKANAAVYVIEEEIFNRLPEEVVPTDFSIDFIPRLLGKIQTLHTSLPFIDIGTPSNLEKARQLWG